MNDGRHLVEASACNVCHRASCDEVALAFIVGDIGHHFGGVIAIGDLFCDRRPTESKNRKKTEQKQQQLRLPSCPDAKAGWSVDGHVAFSVQQSCSLANPPGRPLRHGNSSILAPCKGAKCPPLGKQEPEGSRRR